MDGLVAGKKHAGWLMAAVCCISGCAGLQRLRPEASLPQALSPSPSLEQVVQAVNANSSRIQSFSSNQAILSGPDFPTLRAAVAFERPLRLRLRAGTGITGAELDLGSNDEVFWLWVRRQPPMYYCRHDQFATSAAHDLVPIEPQWLVEALGIVDLDPGLPHQGPIPLSGNRLQVNTIRDGPTGPSTKITVVDARSAAVLEQYLYDAQGQLVAGAVAHQHRQDPLTGLIVPKMVEIRCPPTDLVMRIDLGNAQINRPLPNPGELWAMPRYDGWPVVDLADPNLRFSAPPTAAGRSAGRLSALGQILGGIRR